MAELECYPVPEEQGVYQLFKNGELVYIGKTDSEAGLAKRLDRHRRRVSARCNLNPSSISFKAVRVFVFTAMDLESALIKHYKNLIDVAWQQSGFGSNDPGRERDTTNWKDSHFDVMYPIDLSLELEIMADSSTLPVVDLLQCMKAKLPYVIRYQKSGRTAHPDLRNTQITLNKLVDSVDSFLLHVANALGPAWQITALPGYVIIYMESKEYRRARYFRFGM
ncbi:MULTISPECIES: GIY-YIG nuclease family protein [unclassified Cyanobium]|uniref:GIY-YIG nuclease family protein n=1 Tax=unclassified Cyanobium TaxID=2627006 RepID=UPI0020CD5891|nr:MULTISPECIES: GIY-YIG nuclease family protein [unclassified Cyanobium]